METIFVLIMDLIYWTLLVTAYLGALGLVVYAYVIFVGFFIKKYKEFKDYE